MLSRHQLELLAIVKSRAGTPCAAFAQALMEECQERAPEYSVCLIQSHTNQMKQGEQSGFAVEVHWHWGRTTIFLGTNAIVMHIYFTQKCLHFELADPSCKPERLIQIVIGYFHGARK